MTIAESLRHRGFELCQPKDLQVGDVYIDTEAMDINEKLILSGRIVDEWLDDMSQCITALTPVDIENNILSAADFDRLISLGPLVPAYGQPRTVTGSCVAVSVLGGTEASVYALHQVTESLWRRASCT